MVSRAADAECDAVARRLGSVRVPVARLDAESAAARGLAIDLERRAVRLGGRWITPTVTWVRHFSVRAMPRKRGAVHQAFAADSWRAVVDQVSTVSATAITPAGSGLLEQLALARARGIAIPRTVVVTDPAAARDLLDSPRVVIKALHQHFVEARRGLLSGVFPEVGERAELGHASLPPVVVQEYVEHDAEIRAYYVAGEIAAAVEITKSGPAQPWLDPHHVLAAQVDPHPALADAVRSLAAAMATDYAAFDFLIAAGTPVFLEANLTGDWRWLEAKLRAEPVTAAVARMLTESHRRAAARVPGRGLDLIAFLSGGSAGQTRR